MPGWLLELMANISMSWNKFVQYMEAHTDFWIAIGTLIIAAFTLLLGIATFLLWRATRNLVRGAERTAERQLRAYIGILHYEIRNAKTGQHPECDIAFKNFGLTPAYKVKVRNEFKFIALPGRPEDFAMTDPNPIAPLAPANETTLKSKADNTLTQDEVDQLELDVARLFCFGEMTYEDAFGHMKTPAHAGQALARVAMFRCPSVTSARTSRDARVYTGITLL
jgi:hypothetical protein